MIRLFYFISWLLYQVHKVYLWHKLFYRCSNKQKDKVLIYNIPLLSIDLNSLRKLRFLEANISNIDFFYDLELLTIYSIVFFFLSSTLETSHWMWMTSDYLNSQWNKEKVLGILKWLPLERMRKTYCQHSKND